MTIKIINKSQHELPNYETIASAGMDLRANIEAPITLKSLERTIVKTGLFIELPIGMKIIVPMAGRGSRLRPHTLTVPKPLIPIAGKPIVHRLVEDIAGVLNQDIEELLYYSRKFW
jgi:hypothetical protein